MIESSLIVGAQPAGASSLMLAGRAAVPVAEIGAGPASTSPIPSLSRVLPDDAFRERFKACAGLMQARDPQAEESAGAGAHAAVASDDPAAVKVPLQTTRGTSTSGNGILNSAPRPVRENNTQPQPFKAPESAERSVPTAGAKSFSTATRGDAPHDRHGVSLQAAVASFTSDAESSVPYVGSPLQTARADSRADNAGHAVTIRASSTAQLGTEAVANLPVSESSSLPTRGVDPAGLSEAGTPGGRAHADDLIVAQFAGVHKLGEDTMHADPTRQESRPSPVVSRTSPKHSEVSATEDASPPPVARASGKQAVTHLGAAAKSAPAVTETRKKDLTSALKFSAASITVAPAAGTIPSRDQASPTGPAVFSGSTTGHVPGFETPLALPASDGSATPETRTVQTQNAMATAYQAVETISNKGVRGTNPLGEVEPVTDRTSTQVTAASPSKSPVASAAHAQRLTEDVAETTLSEDGNASAGAEVGPPIATARNSVIEQRLRAALHAAPAASVQDTSAVASTTHSEIATRAGANHRAAVQKTTTGSASPGTGTTATAATSDVAGKQVAADIKSDATGGELRPAIMRNMSEETSSGLVALTSTVSPASNLPNDLNAKTATTGSQGQVMTTEKTLEMPAAAGGSHQLGHTTLVSTPHVLEVGVASGTNGWLKVRAETDGTGGVAASVVTTTAIAADAMHKELPALSAYLHSESVGVSSLAVHQGDSMHEVSAGLSTASFGAGSHREQEAPSGSSYKPVLPEPVLATTGSSPHAVQVEPSESESSSRAHGAWTGGWLNVVA